MRTVAKDTFFWSPFSLNCRGKLLHFEGPCVMGILNTTPDSFYDQSRIQDVQQAIDTAGKMLEEGALFLDIGGASTRPGAVNVPAGVEAARVIPIIVALRKAFPEAILSVDTWRSEIAREAVQAGADMINDISAGDFDKQMFPTIAKLEVPYIVMHTIDRPAVMQRNPIYDNVVKDIIHHLSERVFRLRSMGVADIIIDPGFGFGKTTEHNFQLLAHLDKFQFFGLPVLVGLSRKSMICNTLDCTPEEALTGTTATHTLALTKGANILRVHDVKEAVQTIAIHTEYMKGMQKGNE